MPYHMADRPTAIVPTMPLCYAEKGIEFRYASNDCGERAHVHAYAGDDEAKFWIASEVELDGNHGLNNSQLRKANRIIRARRGELLRCWWRHCSQVTGS